MNKFEKTATKSIRKTQCQGAELVTVKIVQIGV